MNQDFIGDLANETEMRKLVNRAWEDEGFQANFGLRKFQPLGWEISFVIRKQLRNLIIPLGIDYNSVDGQHRTREEIRHQLSIELAT